MDGKVRVRLAHIQEATSGCKADSTTKNLKLNVSSKISTVNRTGTTKTLEEFFLNILRKTSWTAALYGPILYPTGARNRFYTNSLLYRCVCLNISLSL
jgi:hypothetical protein